MGELATGSTVWGGYGPYRLRVKMSSLVNLVLSFGITFGRRGKSRRREGK